MKDLPLPKGFDPDRYLPPPDFEPERYLTSTRLQPPERDVPVVKVSEVDETDWLPSAPDALSRRLTTPEPSLLAEAAPRPRAAISTARPATDDLAGGQSQLEPPPDFNPAKYFRPAHGERVTSRVRDDADFSETEPPASGAPDAVTIPVKLAPGEENTIEPDELARRAVYQFAETHKIPLEYTNKWIVEQEKAGNLRLHRLSDNQPTTMRELRNTRAYDPQTNTVTLHGDLPFFPQMLADYERDKGYVQRIKDDYQDPNKKAGAVALDVVGPPVAAASRGVEVATRPLQALSTGLSGVDRAINPVVALSEQLTGKGRNPVDTLKGIPDAMWHELTTGETRPGYENSLTATVDNLGGSAFDRINPNLRPLVREVTNIIGDPLIALGVIGKARRAARLAKLGEDAGRSSRSLELLGLRGRLGPTTEADELGLVARGEKPASLLPLAPGGDAAAQGRALEAARSKASRMGLSVAPVEGLVELQSRGQKIGKKVRVLSAVFARTKEDAERAAARITHALSGEAVNHAEIGRTLGYTEADIREYYRLNRLGKVPPSDARLDELAATIEKRIGVRPTLERLADDSIRVTADFKDGGKPVTFTIPPGGLLRGDRAPVERAARDLSVATATEEGPIKFTRGSVGRAVSAESTAAPAPSLARRAGRGALDLWNASREIKTSFDFSAPRNAVIPTLTHPVHAARQMVAQVKAFASEEAAANYLRAIRTDEVLPLAEESGLRIQDFSGPASQRNELFRSAIAEAVPGVRASSRAFHTYLNGMRFGIFRDYALSHPTASAEDLKGVASFLNYATGQGSFGKLEGSRAVKVLSEALYAPRLTLSYFQTGASPFTLETAAARKFAAAQIVKAVGTGLALGGLAKLTSKKTGVDFEFNPTATDAFEFKVGQHRIGIFGGYRSLAKFTAQAIMGQRKTSGGRTQDISRLTPLKTFARSRLHPSIGFFIDLKTGETLDGRELYNSDGTLRKGAAARDLLMPMSAGDILDAVRAEKKGVLLAPLALGGADVQTYEQRPSKPVTDRQKEYIFGLADHQRINEDEESARLFGGRKVSELNSQEASQLIEHLKLPGAGKTLTEEDIELKHSQVSDRYTLEEVRKEAIRQGYQIAEK